jgi:hypothetical protein
MLPRDTALQEKAMTCLYSDAAEAKPVGTSAIVAVAAVVLVVLCATGIAAFAGLLPGSDRVASAVTATPIIDVQIDGRMIDGRQGEPDSPMEPQLKNGDSATSAG